MRPRVPRGARGLFVDVGINAEWLDRHGLALLTRRLFIAGARALAGRTIRDGTAIASSAQSMSRAAVLVLIAFAAGCVGSTPSARVQAEPPGADRLAGQWSGTYVVESGPGTGGTLSFTLQSRDADIAAGPVVLKPEGAPGPYVPAGAGDPTLASAASASGSPLAIRLVAASDGLFYGDIDLYRDVVRRTDATMTLRGKVEGDAIRGTFRTTYADGSAQTEGRWTVTRLTSAG
jgi:hypothetical protein